ncbi:DNA-binding transcriptional regulator CytR [Enterobacteriaceae bacterium LUAb1]
MEQNHKLMNVTMKAVAAHAGVSTATVSRTLMNPDKVSVFTRQKVEKAVMDMGYTPLTTMRNTKHNSTKTILIVVPDICDPFFSEIIHGAELTATQQNYLVLISNCAHQHRQGNSFLNLLTTRQIDGIVLLGSRSPFAEQLPAIPMVMANEFAPGLALPAVHIDNLTAAFEAVLHLQQLGHRRIACITGPDDIPLCRYRLQGYLQALRRSELPIDPTYIIRGEFTLAAGAQALEQLMSLPLPPQAIFCHSDIIALGAMKQAKLRGLRIPQDLSLIGFDDIELSHYSDPPLTTVAQPRFSIGREAMLLLLAQLNGKNVNNGSRLLDFELKLRGSTLTPQTR